MDLVSGSGLEKISLDQEGRQEDPEDVLLMTLTQRRVLEGPGIGPCWLLGPRRTWPVRGSTMLLFELIKT